MNTTGEKSHVGLSLCFFCQESKEVLLDRRLRSTLAPAAVYDRVPCDKCKGYMKQGIICISCDEAKSKGDLQNPYRTGGWCVVTDDYLKRVVSSPELLDQILKARITFLPDDTWQLLGLPYGDVKRGDPGYKR